MEADQIEARYSDADLLRIIRAHGVDDTLPAAPAAGDSPPVETGGVA